jgi:hypothetical protein
MLLNTDEPHPHVHMVVKAVSERGERLNIRKATLRRWRADFAERLRTLGVAANATERAVRGANRPNWHDGIYRADLRGDSTFVREREALDHRDLPAGRQRVVRSGSVLPSTRREIEAGWLGLVDSMIRAGRKVFADQSGDSWSGCRPHVRTWIGLLTGPGHRHGRKMH